LSALNVCTMTVPCYWIGNLLAHPGLPSFCALHTGSVPLTLSVQLHWEQPDSDEAGDG